MIDIEQDLAFLEKTAVSEAVIDGGDLAEDLRYQRTLGARLYRAVALQSYLVGSPLQFQHIHCELRSRGRNVPVSLRRITHDHVGQTEKDCQNHYGSQLLDETSRHVSLSGASSGDRFEICPLFPVICLRYSSKVASQGKV